jgi:hypothetical protein
VTYEVGENWQLYGMPEMLSGAGICCPHTSDGPPELICGAIGALSSSYLADGRSVKVAELPFWFKTWGGGWPNYILYLADGWPIKVSELPSLIRDMHILYAHLSCPSHRRPLQVAGFPFWARS